VRAHECGRSSLEAPSSAALGIVAIHRDALRQFGPARESPDPSRERPREPSSREELREGAPGSTRRGELRACGLRNGSVQTSEIVGRRRIDCRTNRSAMRCSRSRRARFVQRDRSGSPLPAPFRKIPASIESYRRWRRRSAARPARRGGLSCRSGEQSAARAGRRATIDRAARRGASETMVRRARGRESLHAVRKG